MSKLRKTAILYCTHLINKEFNFFLDHGYIKSDHIDFYICFNSDLDAEKYNKKYKEMDLNNIYFFSRENKGHDFGAWTYLLNLTINNDKISNVYDYYFFINSSCMGPFLPIYCDKTWVEYFQNMITNKIKLIGPTINPFNGKPHVQSYFMCTDKIGLDIGINKGIFVDDNVIRTKWELIIDKEIGYSLEIIKEGYEIKSMLHGQKNINFSKTIDISNDILPFQNTTYNGDICYNNAYNNMTLHPFEVIFFKSNRNITPNIIESYTNMINYKK